MYLATFGFVIGPECTALSKRDGTRAKNQSWPFSKMDESI